MTARSLRQPGGPTELRGPNGDPARVIRRLRWAILLNSLFIALELAAGFTVNSLALISDAWHNLTDVLGLGIAWFAVRQVRRPADPVRTFGYHRAGILAALGNSLFLGVITLTLFLEAVERLRHPPPAGGGVILAVAAIGVIINGTVAFILAGAWRIVREAVNVLMEGTPRGLDVGQDRFRISHATIQLEVALPAQADPLPIHHEGGTVQW